MPDTVGYRAKMAVIVPSTNTVVEHDYNVMRPPGVTFHVGRMFIADAAAADDEAFERLMEQIRASADTAIRDVLTCEPDHLIMGMSSETFWGGTAGNKAFIGRAEQRSGLAVTAGAEACLAACERLGLRRIAVLTPYQPVGDRQVRRYFAETGVEVARLAGLRCPTATAIADVDEDTLRQELCALDGPDIDAIVQVGTNLSMLRLADEAERWLRKPVLAINAVTLWHALRTQGFRDQQPGVGLLLRDH